MSPVNVSNMSLDTDPRSDIEGSDPQGPFASNTIEHYDRAGPHLYPFGARGTRLV